MCLYLKPKPTAEASRRFDYSFPSHTAKGYYISPVYPFPSVDMIVILYVSANHVNQYQSIVRCAQSSLWAFYQLNYVVAPK